MLNFHQELKSRLLGCKRLYKENKVKELIESLKSNTSNYFSEYESALSNFKTDNNFRTDFIYRNTEVARNKEPKASDIGSKIKSVTEDEPFAKAVFYDSCGNTKNAENYIEKTSDSNIDTIKYVDFAHPYLNVSLNYLKEPVSIAWWTT